MKRFIHRLLVFFLITIILGSIICVVFVLIINSKTNEIRLNDNITDIYIGDSHLQCAIQDSLLLNSKNLGTSSESYYFSYFKLNHVLKSNPNIHRVYLGYSYHNLSEYYDEYIFGKFSNSVSPNYFFILPFKEQMKMIRWNLSDLPAYIKSILKKGVIIMLPKRSLPFIGGYENPFSDVSAIKSSMDKRLNLQYYSNGDIIDFSSINLSYFNKIINLCNDYNVEIILLNTPLHKYYQSKLPTEYIKEYNAIIDKTKLNVIDFQNFDFTDSCFIPDGDHVSMEGALQTTKELIRINSNTQHAIKKH